MQIQMEFVGQLSNVHQDILLLILQNHVSRSAPQDFIRTLLYKPVTHVWQVVQTASIHMNVLHAIVQLLFGMILNVIYIVLL